jgi:hypothetical protein
MIVHPNIAMKPRPAKISQQAEVVVAAIMTISADQPKSVLAILV